MDRGGLTYAHPAIFEWLLEVEKVVRGYLDVNTVKSDTLVDLLQTLSRSMSLRDQLGSAIQAGLYHKLRGFGIREEDMVPLDHQPSLNLIYADFINLFTKTRMRQFKRKVLKTIKLKRRDDALRKRLKNRASSAAAGLQINKQLLSSMADGDQFHSHLSTLVCLHGKAVFEHRSCTKDILEGLLRAYSSAGELPQGLTRSSLKPEFVEAAKNVVLGSTEVKCIDRLKQVLHRGTSS